MRVPARPIGTSQDAMFKQWVYDMLLMLMPKVAPGVRTDFTTRGVFRRGVEQTASSTSNALPEFKLKVCLTIDGVDEEVFLVVNSSGFTRDPTGYVDPPVVAPIPTV